MSIRRIYRRSVFRVLKLLSLSISALLGVFCSFGGCMYGPAPEYGMPHAEYKATGTVKSASDHKPVKGILVSIISTEENAEILNSTQTDSSGRYSLLFSRTPLDTVWRLRAEDVDSAENGSFATKDTNITVVLGSTEIKTDLEIDETN